MEKMSDSSMKDILEEVRVEGWGPERKREIGEVSRGQNPEIDGGGEIKEVRG